MTLLDINPQRLHGYCSVNGIIGLALDLLPSGKAIACEVRKDEEGEFRTPLAEMTTSDFYALASRLGLEILSGKDATKQEIEATRLAMRKGGADRYLAEGEVQPLGKGEE